MHTYINNDTHPLDTMVSNCEAQAGDPSECPPENCDWWISQDYEDAHMSKRLIKELDTVSEEIVMDKTHWTNVRFHEMEAALYSDAGHHYYH